MKRSSEKIDSLRVDGASPRLRLKQVFASDANRGVASINAEYSSRIEAAKSQFNEANRAASDTREENVQAARDQLTRQFREHFGADGEIWVVTSRQTEKDYDDWGDCSESEQTEQLVAVCDDVKMATRAAKSFYGANTAAIYHSVTAVKGGDGSFSVAPGKVAMGGQRVDTGWEEVRANKIRLNNDRHLKWLTDFLIEDRVYRPQTEMETACRESYQAVRLPEEPLRRVELNTNSVELNGRLRAARELVEQREIADSKKIIEQSSPELESAIADAKGLAKEHRDLSKLLNQKSWGCSNELFCNFVKSHQIGPEVVVALVATPAVGSFDGIRSLNRLLIRLTGQGLDWESPIVQKKMGRLLHDAAKERIQSPRSWDEGENLLSQRRQIRQSRRGWLEASTKAFQADIDLAEARLLLRAQEELGVPVDLRLEPVPVNPDEYSLSWREDGMWKDDCDIEVAQLTLDSEVGRVEWRVAVSPDCRSLKVHQVDSEASSPPNENSYRWGDVYPGTDMRRFCSTLSDLSKFAQKELGEFLEAKWKEGDVIIPNDVRVDLMGYPEDRLSDTERIEVKKINSELNRLAALYDLPESGYKNALKPNQLVAKESTLLSQGVKIADWTNRRSFELTDLGSIKFSARHCGSDHCSICAERVRKIRGGLQQSGVESYETSEGYFSIQGFIGFDQQKINSDSGDYRQWPLNRRAAAYLGKAIGQYLEIE